MENIYKNYTVLYCKIIYLNYLEPRTYINCWAFAGIRFVEDFTPSGTWKDNVSQQVLMLLEPRAGNATKRERLFLCKANITKFKMVELKKKLLTLAISNKCGNSEDLNVLVEPILVCPKLAQIVSLAVKLPYSLHFFLINKEFYNRWICYNQNNLFLRLRMWITLSLRKSTKSPMFELLIYYRKSS